MGVQVSKGLKELNQQKQHQCNQPSFFFFSNANTSGKETTKERNFYSPRVQHISYSEFNILATSQFYTFQYGEKKIYYFILFMYDKQNTKRFFFILK